MLILRILQLQLLRESSFTCKQVDEMVWSTSSMFLRVVDKCGPESEEEEVELKGGAGCPYTYCVHTHRCYVYNIYTCTHMSIYKVLCASIPIYFLLDCFGLYRES